VNTIIPGATADEGALARAAAAGGREKRAYVRQMFSDIAPRYDLLNHLLSLNIDKGWRRAAIGELGLQLRPAGRYLDLCAGTLDVAAQMTRIAGFTGTVIGADFAEPMLRRGVGKAPASRLSPLTADALELPIRSGTMDGAIVAFGIRNVADLDAGLREVRRVLAPGARLVILEFSTPSIPPVRALYLFYFKHILPLVGRLVSGHRTAYTYLPASVANFPDRDELATRMKAAGFTNVRWRSVTFGIAAIHVGERPPR
jgi:demethylmenaquinone methyltransferase/2-methoxy-6-polyprenyl-1,4-benzoquinol methylase